MPSCDFCTVTCTYLPATYYLLWILTRGIILLIFDEIPSAPTIKTPIIKQKLRKKEKNYRKDPRGKHSRPRLKIKSSCARTPDIFHLPPLWQTPAVQDERDSFASYQRACSVVDIINVFFATLFLFYFSYFMVSVLFIWARFAIADARLSKDRMAQPHWREMGKGEEAVPRSGGSRERLSTATTILCCRRFKTVIATLKLGRCCSMALHIPDAEACMRLWRGRAHDAYYITCTYIHHTHHLALSLFNLPLDFLDNVLALAVSINFSFLFYFTALKQSNYSSSLRTHLVFLPFPLSHLLSKTNIIAPPLLFFLMPFEFSIHLFKSIYSNASLVGLNNISAQNILTVQFPTAQAKRRLLLSTHPRSVFSPSIPVLIPTPHSAVPCSSNSSNSTRHR